MQLAKSKEVGTLWIPVRNSLHIVAKVEGEGVTKLSLHLRVEKAGLLAKYAAVENALVFQRIKAAGREAVEPAVSWTRKSLAEEFLAAQVEDLAERVADRTKALGEMPDPDDEEAVQEYARRALAWEQKHQRR